MNDEEYQKNINKFIEKYTLLPLDELKNKIKMAKFNYVITDPYPEITEANNHNSIIKEFNKNTWFNKQHQVEVPKISAHKAFKEGMDFMWKLIEPLVK